MQENKSALLWACWNGHDRVVKLLIKAGAIVNSLDKVHILLLITTSNHCLNLYRRGVLQFGQLLSMDTKNVYNC